MRVLSRYQVFESRSIIITNVEVLQDSFPV